MIILVLVTWIDGPHGLSIHTTVHSNMASLNQQVELDRKEPTEKGEIFNWTYSEFNIDKNTEAISSCGHNGFFTF